MHKHTMHAGMWTEHFNYGSDKNAIWRVEYTCLKWVHGIFALLFYTMSYLMTTLLYNVL